MRRDLPEVGEAHGPPALTMPAERVIEALRPCVTERRLLRIEEVVRSRVASVVPVLENLADPHNAAAVMRSADAFGLQNIHVIQSRHTFLVSRRVARGTDRWLDVTRFDSADSCVDALHARGFEVYVAQMEGTLTPDDLATKSKVAVVLGNEHSGASSTALARADGAYRVPMRGFVESLNVSVAGAVTLHRLTRDRQGELEPEAQRDLLARFMMASVENAGKIIEEYWAKR